MKGEENMYCPKCSSDRVTVQAVNEITEKRKKGLVYWLLIGWWWEPLAWLFLTIPKIIIAIFGNKKKTKSVMKSYAVCQKCGYRWQLF